MDRVANELHTKEKRKIGYWPPQVFLWQIGGEGVVAFSGKINDREGVQCRLSTN